MIDNLLYFRNNINCYILNGVSSKQATAFVQTAHSFQRGWLTDHRSHYSQPLSGPN